MNPTSYSELPLLKPLLQFCLLVLLLLALVDVTAND
jgi:hypothetical protein|nr:hypothetical protein Q903MT_gene2378 [Picea sitchensis]